MRKTADHRKPGEKLADVLIPLLILVVVTVSIYPFFYILFYSFSNASQVGGQLLLFPKGFTLDAYKLLVTSVPDLGRAFLVSVGRSLLGPVLTILVSAMGAYVLTRTELPARGFLSKFITVTMYFTSGMIPTYILMQQLRLAGTFWVYILPGMFSVFNMLLIKTYIESLPPGLQESAVIDGANDYQLFFRIVLPLCKSVIAATLLYECIWHWNMYSDNMLYNTSKPELSTLQYILMNFVQTNTSSAEAARRQAMLTTINSTTLKMAMTAVTTLPILCVYPFLQKYFAKGILIGSMKG